MTLRLRPSAWLRTSSGQDRRSTEQRSVNRASRIDPALLRSTGTSCPCGLPSKPTAALQGVSTTNLMGEMGPLVNLDHFQLALPFTWDEWRVTRLCETLGGAT